MVSGRDIRLNRITKKGKMVCIPMDHGITNGPIKGLENTPDMIYQCENSGLTSVIINKGIVKSMPKTTNIGLITHLSASTSLSPYPNKKVLMGSVADAVRHGSDAVSVHINIGAKEEPEMLEILGMISDECDEWNVPLLAMMYPRGENIKNPFAPEIVGHVTRIGAEAGADIVKSVYTGDLDSFKSVVKSCPVPVVIAGGPKSKTDTDVLEMCSNAIKAGAKGVTFGRNIFQHENPSLLVKALSEIIVDEKNYNEVLKNFGKRKKKRKKNFKIIYESELADIIICKSIEDLIKNKTKDKSLAYYKRVLSNEDLSDIENAVYKGANYIIVDATNWKIIPLENIIANLQNTKTRIYTTAKNSEEVRTMFTVLELGVDGVILSTANVKEIEESKKYLKNKKYEIQSCEIVDVKDVGIGERVCVDTVSMLETGEGMLVGSKSNFLFLLHNESAGSSFTSPRPFRVNAGAVYCYTILPDGKTKYLSELESGSEIIIVNKDGNSRVVSVGRSKIETRPLRLIRAVGENVEGTVIVQNAETIQLIRDNGDLVPVTHIKPGDKILCYFKQASGRHFGVQVQEYILEK